MKRKTTLWLFAAMFIIIFDVGSAYALSISGIKPTAGVWGETGLDVHIYGNGTAFDETSYAEFIPQTGSVDVITVNYTTYVSPTEVIANITINAGAGETLCDVHVKSAGGQYELVDGFTICDSRIFSVDPSSFARGHTMDVDITGRETQFIDGQSTVVFDPPDGITVNTTTVIDATHATANITIGLGAPATARNVNVSTAAVPDPHPLNDGFKVREPVIDSVSPSSVVQGQSLVIDVKGNETAFVDGQSYATFDPPDGITVISTVVQSEHYASVTIDIDLTAPTSPRSVNVITPCSGVPPQETPQPLAGGLDISEDLCPSDPAKTDPGVCGCGTPDTDSDGDGTPDCNDGCPADPAKTDPGVCGCGVADTNSDGDGTPDCNDGCPNDPAKAAPGICGCGVSDVDTDGDGTPDCNDGCPNDPAKAGPGICGCGVSDVDTDGDGTADCNDGCPNDPAKAAPGICGCGVSDVDTDGDGTADCNDLCPDDPDKTSPGVCGCGNSDIDRDGNGIPDCQDRENWPADLDLDGNGIPDREQDDIMVVFSGIEGLYFGIIISDDDILEYLEWIDAATITDMNGRPDATFPLGLVSFRVRTTVAGKAIQLMLYSSTPIPEDALWFKYDPVNGWYDYSSYVFVGEDGLSLTLLLEDGGYGDADGVIDGFIEDPIGPALFEEETTDDDTNAGEGSHSSGGCFIQAILD